MSEASTLHDFSTFGRRLRLTGRLRTETALRIGSGETDDLRGADIAVMKDQQRRPFIPGSSFKGALRSHVERLVRSLWPEQDTRLAACDPLSEAGRCIPGRWPGDTEAKPASVKTIEELRSQAKNGASAHADRNTLSDLIWQNSCLVCRVFGSPWMASKVLLKDLNLAMPELWVEGRYQMRTGVGIERDSDAAAEAVLYSGETVPPGTEFAWEIVVENADASAEEPLLFLALREMQQGRIPLGGARSRGLGSVSLQVDLIEEVNGSDRSALIAYLAQQLATQLSWADLEARIVPWVQQVAQEKRS